MNKILSYPMAALALVLIMFLFNNESVQAKKKPETAAESEKYQSGLYEIKYRNVLSYYSNVLIDADSVYIPLFDFFSKLKIYFEYDNKEKLFKGFFIEQNDDYRIDFSRNTAVFDEKEYTFNASDYIIQDGEVYVLPSLINKIFSIDFLTNNSNLNIYVRSQKDLPVYLFFLRNKNRQNNLSSLQDNYEDLLFDRKRSVLDGFILNYNLGAVNNGSNTSYNMRTNFGLEVMGGALTTTASANFSQATGDWSHNLFYAWDYVFDENRYLNQVSAGYVSTNTLSGTSSINNNLIGVKVSNEPIEYNGSFSSKTIEGTTGPGWQVELYVNSRLITQARTNKDGAYKFEVPIRYGYNRILLKFYGRKGEIDEKSQTIFIPSFLIRPGEFDYTLAAGQALETKSLNGAGILSLGLTDWMSLSGGVSRNFDARTYEYYGYLSMNLLSSLNAVVFASQDIYSLDLMQPLSDYSSVRGLITFYNPQSAMAKRNLLYNANISVNPPNLEIIPMHFNLRFNRSAFTNFGASGIDLLMGTNFNSFNLKFKYSADFRDDGGFNNITDFRHILNSQASYRLSARNFLWSALDRISFSVSTNYDLNRSLFRDIRMSVNKNLFNVFRMSLGLNKNLVTQRLTYYGSLSLYLNLEGIKSSSRGYYYDNGNRSLSQNFSGTLMLDTYDPGFLMNRYTYRTSVNTGAAAFRFFLDDNLDGNYDEGEQIIPDVRVMTDKGSIDRGSNNEMAYVYNIPPYRRINTYVKQESFSNPLWLPTKSAFSFIADPNNVKGMDIPCYAAGIIEGRITRVSGNRTTAVNGVKLHLMKKDSTFNESIPVFSDGSFYYMGVPPGDYMIWVDSTQLALLGVNAKEPFKEFRIEITTQGDYVGGINFELVPKYFNQSAEDNLSKSSTDNNLADGGDGLASSSSAGKTGGSPSKKKSQASKPAPEAEPKLIDKKAFLYNGAKDITLSADMKKYLDYAAGYLKKNPSSKLSVTGYADSFGPADDIKDISDKRAKKAFDYLVGIGVSPDKIATAGRGADPTISGSTADDRKKNRRLEIQILE